MPKWYLLSLIALHKISTCKVKILTPVSKQMSGRKSKHLFDNCSIWAQIKMTGSELFVRVFALEKYGKINNLFKK